MTNKSITKEILKVIDSFKEDDPIFDLINSVEFLKGSLGAIPFGLRNRVGQITEDNIDAKLSEEQVLGELKIFLEEIPD